MGGGKEKKNVNRTRHVVLLALFVAQALVLSILESWIPVPVPIPGIKLGLANIVTFLVLMFFGLKDALTVMLVRCVLAAFFGGGVTMLLFSVAGGVFSTLVMAILYQKGSKYFSITGISVAGAASHNMGQLLMASFIMRDAAVMSYLPVLMLSSIATGVFTGLCSEFLSRALRKLRGWT